MQSAWPLAICNSNWSKPWRPTTVSAMVRNVTILPWMDRRGWYKYSVPRKIGPEKQYSVSTCTDQSRAEDNMQDPFTCACPCDCDCACDCPSSESHALPSFLPSFLPPSLHEQTNKLTNQQKRVKNSNPRIHRTIALSIKPL